MLEGLNQPTFITAINVFILLHTFDDNLVDVDFDVRVFYILAKCSRPYIMYQIGPQSS